MKKQPSYFIRMLEIGIEHQLDGISFQKLTEVLVDDLKYDLKSKCEDQIITWFFENFYEPEAEVYRQRTIKNGEVPQFIHLANYKLSPAYIKGNAVMKYIDYLELEEARKASLQAQKTAIWAIFISAVLAAFSIGLQLAGYFH